jgi:PAS domain S-box-containing protein
MRTTTLLPETAPSATLDSPSVELLSMTRALLDRLPGMAYRRSPDGRWRVEVVSAGCRSITRYAPDAFLSGDVSFGDLIHPEDRERVAEVVQRALDRRRPFELTYRIVLPDGSEKWVSERAEPVLDASGAPECIEGLIEDVSDRVRIEQEIRRHEAMLEESQRIASVGSWEWNPVTGETRWSEELYRILGLSPVDTEPSRDVFLSLMHPDDRARGEQAMQEALRSGDAMAYDYRIVRRDGSVRALSSRARVLRDASGEVTLVIGTAQDITERKAAEQALAEREELFRRIANETPAYLWMSSADQANAFINRGLGEFLGVEPSALGDGWIGFVHPDDMPQALAIFGDAQRAQRAFSMELRVRRHDGAWRWMVDLGSPRFSEPGEFLGFAGSLVDITERREADAELRFLADASALLGTSLDLDRLLDELTKLAIPRLGDACLIDVMHNGQHSRRVGASRLSADQRVLIDEFVASSRPLEAGSAFMRVMESRQPLFVPEVGEEEIQMISRGDERIRAIARAIRPRSIISVPLVSRGAVLGALNFFVNDPDRRLGERELSLAMALADRAAAALENAQLYQAARAELAERERAERERASSEAVLHGFFETPGIFAAILEIDDASDDFIFRMPNGPLAASYGTGATRRAKRT